MTRLITCLLLMLLSATALFAQKRPSVRPAQTGIKPGYYFMVDMCHACYYPNWTKDLLRLFQAQGMRAITYEGAMMESANERCASVKMFSAARVMERSRLCWPCPDRKGGARGPR